MRDYINNYLKLLVSKWRTDKGLIIKVCAAILVLLFGLNVFLKRADKHGSEAEPLVLNSDGTVVDKSWLPSWLYKRETINYAAITAEAFQQRSRFLAMTVDQDVVRDQTIFVGVAGFRSRARVRVSYHVQYPIGYVLESGKFSVAGEGESLVITLDRPTLISDVAVRLTDHKVLEGGLLVNEADALLNIQKKVQPEAAGKAAAILARPGIIPKSEAALRGFLQPILKAKADGGPLPRIRFQYR